MDVVVKTGQTSLLLRDALRRPLAELEMGAIQASLRRVSATVMQFYCGISVSAWSFNPVVSAWEPLLESWNLIVKMDANKSPTVSSARLHGEETVTLSDMQQVSTCQADCVWEFSTRARLGVWHISYI